MCGICGYFGSGASVPPEALARMNRTLVRRGPDQDGMLHEPEAGLAMRRLSIIDVGGGRQPIDNEDGSVSVVFNGEIYNYRALRADLVRRGHRFSTDSDTEVLVHLYEEHGERLVEHLRGMFAFALWDRRRRRGVLARDRLGIKPLFYAHVDGGLVFGSEIKALLASGRVGRRLDPQALDAFIAFTYIPAPLTIFAEIRKLEPGHLIVYAQGEVRRQRYWDVDFGGEDTDTSRDAWAERCEAAIDDAVACHLVSDVPVGAFLSGGVDSSLVVGLAARHLRYRMQTFTIGFAGAQGALLDERPLAAQVAARYGCAFHDAVVRPDFRAIAGEIVDAFDEPFADDSVIPTYYLAQRTRENVKVALSGLGGDELFAGYQRYSGTLLANRYAKLVPPLLHKGVISPLVHRLPEPRHGRDAVDHAKRFAASVLESPARRYLGFVSSVPPPVRPTLFHADVARGIDFHATDRLVTDPFERCAAREDVSRALYADMKTYLPEDILALSDRLSMWHSLEVRVPLVDHVLVELSARVPVVHKIDVRRKKILLKRLAARHVPRQVLHHRKQGFEAPMGAWLRGSLAGYARDVLGAQRLGASGLFDGEEVARRLDEHVAGRQKHSKLLFSLIMFQEWYERHTMRERVNA